MIKKALIRKPGKSLIKGITTADLGLPDIDLARKQHQEYGKALTDCGVEVITLPSDEKYPDSVFVEDTAIVTEEVAIITRPGAESRRGEEEKVQKTLQNYYKAMEKIKSPGTLEGGDVLQVGDKFFVGQSKRTNREGIKQFEEILTRYGYSCIPVKLKEFLHLKTGVSYLGQNTVILAGELLKAEVFKNFNRIQTAQRESYSANCIRINDYVIFPAGYEKTEERIREAGFRVKTVDVSEYRKIDGGLSCLSLRF